MPNQEANQMTKLDAMLKPGPITYIVMDAPGYYGTYATVYSRHAILQQAIRTAKRLGKSVMVSTDGGWSATHQPGSQIHRQFAGSYRRLS